eukprot:TRINITY_DN19522_c0_g2_i1.p1 TRINITY_DN19522_c0_g2~~TRINITY_DN19522_c0_g2_i1.p1  ORF type:complete len:346 (-),score=51.76 TRINITY_DN19522_c0_g2_i1:363-1400(-)
MASSVSQVRQALWEAVARGRQKIITPIVRKSSRSTIPPKQRPQLANLYVEELEYQTEQDTLSSQQSQQWVPLRIIKPVQDQTSKLPAVVFLHATGGTKDQMLDRMIKYAHKGFFTAAIDCRYHGDRSTGSDGNWKSYQESLVRAWREGIERPFLLDNVWDIQHLIDYFETRPDIDVTKIGMTGVSLGGMHTWLSACLDDRIYASAPIIGCQSFGWAVQNEAYHGRAGSIPLVFDAAKQDAGLSELNKDIVQKVWDKLIPGITDAYDLDKSLPCIAPRPLMVLNGEKDDRCPVQGLEPVLKQTQKIYEDLGVASNFEVFIETGVGHECTPAMDSKVEQFMEKHLLV